MPWTTPTLSQVRTLNRDFVTAHLPSGSLIPNSVLRVLADSNAGLAHLTLQYLDWLARQLLPDTAEGDWLRDRHAMIWLGGWKQATYADGLATFTGLSISMIPAATRLSAALGSGLVEYETISEGQIDATGLVDVAIRALTPGAIGNLEGGTTLMLTSALTGVDGVVTVVELSGGADEESDEELRRRVLDRIRKPPMGGDSDDYVAWALEVPGVTRAWASPLEMGIGTVTVRFMMDNLRIEDGGFPNADDIALVQAYLDERRPVAVKDFFVVAPIPEPIDFTIDNLTPDEATTRAAIETSVIAMLADRAAPGFAINGVSQGAQTIYRAWVSEAISRADAVDSFTLTMSDHHMPSAGHMGVLGSIIYG